MKKCVFHLILLTFMLLFSACKEEVATVPPADLIPAAKMEEMVAEQLVMESVLFQTSPEVDKAQLSRAAYAAWFKKYGVTQSQFEKSVDYYFTDADRSAELMSRVRQRIENERCSTR